MYDVRIIGETDLPAGHDWALVEREGSTTLLVKESALGPEVVAEAWAAYRKLDRRHTPCRRDISPDTGEPLLRLA